MTTTKPVGCTCPNPTSILGNCPVHGSAMRFGGGYPRRVSQELSEAAVEWWLAHRPLDFSEEDHFDNPTINCTGDIERRLATCVADLLRTERDV